MIDKKSLSEEDICTKFITPAIEKTGWDRHTMMNGLFKIDLHFR